MKTDKLLSVLTLLVSVAILALLLSQGNVKVGQTTSEAAFCASKLICEGASCSCNTTIFDPSGDQTWRCTWKIGKMPSTIQCGGGEAE